MWRKKWKENVKRIEQKVIGRGLPLPAAAQKKLSRKDSLKTKFKKNERGVPNGTRTHDIQNHNLTL